MIPPLTQGQLVEHKDLPGEVFVIHSFNGVYLGQGKGFRYKVFVKPLEELSAVPVAANVEELKPVTIH